MTVSNYLKSFQKNHLIVVYILTILLFGCFFNNLAVLFKYDFPLGVDGYYYIIQIETFLEKGEFYYPTKTPVILYLAVGLSSLGIESTTAMKIISSLLYVILILAIYLILSRLTDNKWTGLIGAGIVAVSVLRLIWIVEFVNNLGGVAFLFCGIYCLGEKSKNKIWFVIGGVFLILAFLSHKSILPLAILILFAYGVFYLLFKSIGTKFFPYLLIFLVIAGFFYPLFFTVIFSNPILSFLSENVAVNPKFPLSVRGFFEEKFILCILAPLSLFVSLWNSKEKNQIALFNGAISILSVFITLNPFLSYTEHIMTVPDRLSQLMAIQISFLLAFTTHLLNYDKILKSIITVSILFFLVLGNTNQTKGSDDRFLLQRQNLIENLERFKGIFSNQSIIIAPHGYQFLLTSVLRISSQNTLPKEESRIYWLIFGVPCSNIENPSTIVSIEGKVCTAILENGGVKPVSVQEKLMISKFNPHYDRMDYKLKEKLIPTQNTADKDNY